MNDAPPPPATARLLTIADASRQLSINEKTLRVYIATGELESVRIGKKGGGIRVRESDLLDFINRLPSGVR